MATVDGKRVVTDRRYVTVTWEGLESGDDGAPVDFGAYADKTAQVTGTFDGESVSIEGSMDGTNWAVLTDGQGDPVTFAAAGVKLIAENPLYIRPHCDGNGTTVDLDVIVGASAV